MTQPPGYGPPPGYPAGPAYLPPPPPPLSPAGVPLAPFEKRLLAYLIDSALLTAVYLVLAVPALIGTFYLLPETDPYATDVDFGTVVTEVFLPMLLLQAGLFALLLLLYYLYAVELMHRSGQTLGKKALKIKVVPIDPGRTLTRGMAAKRYAVEFPVGLIVPLFSFLDGLWQLWDKPYQQTLHDKAAETVVVKVSP